MMSRHECVTEIEHADPPAVAYSWCLDCERAYKRGEHRRVKASEVLRSVIPDLEFLEECHYADCAGDATKGVLDWVRIQSDNDYPLVPKRGVVYPHCEKTQIRTRPHQRPCIT